LLPLFWAEFLVLLQCIKFARVFQNVPKFVLFKWHIRTELFQKKIKNFLVSHLTSNSYINIAKFIPFKGVCLRIIIIIKTGSMLWLKNCSGSFVTEQLHNCVDRLSVVHF
jgi:hypothetical protein